MDSIYQYQDLSPATYSIENKEQKLMEAIALGKKYCLEFHKDPFFGPLLFNIFMCDLLIIFKEDDFASYADDNTPFASEAILESVVSPLESCSASLFEWFSNNQMKTNPENVNYWWWTLIGQLTLR